MGQEKSAKLRQTVGGIVSSVAGLVTISFGVVFLFSEYNIILKGFSEAGKNAGVVMQSVHQPIFTQILGLAGIMLLVGAYGFFIKRNWAWVVAFIGSTIGVFGGFMLMMFPLMVLLPMKHTHLLLYHNMVRSYYM